MIAIAISLPEHPSLARRLVLFALAALLMPGCVERPKIQPGPELSKADAVNLVNRNVAEIRGTLRASGSMDVKITEEGSTRRESLEGNLLFHRPCYVRLDLKKLGATQLVVGCNADGYWYRERDRENFECGRHGTAMYSSLPIEPLQLIDALGLTEIPTGLPRPGEAGRMHRTVQEFQQLLFVEDDPRFGRYIRKELWLDRYEPRLVARVIFRNPDGKIELESILGDYRRVEDANLYLPHKVEAHWSDPELDMKFNIRSWTVFPQVGPGSIQFTMPSDCVVY